MLNCVLVVYTSRNSIQMCLLRNQQRTINRLLTINQQLLLKLNFIPHKSWYFAQEPGLKIHASRKIRAAAAKYNLWFQ